MMQNSDSINERPPIWVGHITLQVSNLSASLKFFLFVGMRQVAKLPGVTVLELRGGTHLVLQSQDNIEPRQASFDLMVDDLATQHRLLQSAGYTVQPIKTGRLHNTFDVTEPSGNIITFFDTHVAGVV